MMFYSINVDNEQKKEGNKRLRKRLLIALLIIVALGLLILYAENFGIFPGGYLNKPVVNSYLEKNYPEYEFDVSYNSYDRDLPAYVYDCSYVDDAGEKQTFNMYAKRYGVTDDGFFDKFLRDFEKELQVADYIEEILGKKWKEQNSSISAVWECTIEIPKSDSEADLKTLMERYSSTVDIVVTLYGEKTTYGDYKNIANSTLTPVRTAGFTTRPSSLQVLYYRDSENMQYESRISGYLFDFSDAALNDTDGVHLYVEVPRDVATEVKIYTVIQYVMFGAIILAILVPVSYKIYKKVSKKYKKKKREQDAQNSDI